MKAINLEEALETFSPAALEFGPEGTGDFYVDRGDDPLLDLRTWLVRPSQTPQKFLLAGHRGSGKTTELNRLSAEPEILNRHEIVKFTVKDELDLTDLSYLDLLFTIISQTYRHVVEDLGLEIGDDAIDSLDRWRTEVTEVVESYNKSAATDVEGGAKLSVLLGAFFTSFRGRLKVEKATRENTRKTIEKQLSDFLKTIDIFFTDVDRALAPRGKRLLVIVEDLDKIPEPKALDLFHKHGLYLARPPCRIIYTVPIAIHYSKAISTVARIFGSGGSFFLPNVPLYEWKNPHVPYKRGREMMENFVLQRLDGSLLSQKALEAAVEASGGIFQQLQRLMSDACIRALGKDAKAVSETEVGAAEVDMCHELERSLDSVDFKILHQVAKTRQAVSDEATRTLLHSLHLLEYRNEERWCDVNPLLKPTLARWPDAG